MMKMRKVKKHHRRSSSSVISYYENSDVHELRKRTRTRMATAIDDHPIDLVLEILHQLDLKSAAQCKSVSKEWCSVITDPFFARCFVNYNNSRPIVDHWPFTLLLQCTNWQTKNGHLLLPLEEEPYFKSLPYIPPMYQEQPTMSSIFKLRVMTCSYALNLQLLVIITEHHSFDTDLHRVADFRSSRCNISNTRSIGRSSIAVAVLVLILFLRLWTSEFL